MASDRDLEIARISIEKGLIQAFQLEECLGLRTDGKPLEAILVEKGYLSQRKLAEIIAELPKKPPSRPPQEDLPPDVAKSAQTPGNVFGKYVLLKELGAGGMGVVYKAWQTDLKRVVALKFLRGVEAEEDISRFMREAQMAAQLSHPGIVSVHETGEIDGKHFIAMPFVDGLTFDKILALREHFPLRRLVSILAEAARAVDYANTQGVIHRDLKPPNIIVEKDGNGRVFVMDFGLAKSIKTASSLTLSGVILGTPSYMPPEQAQGRLTQIDARSDVYSLGAILYEIGAGQPPFAGESAMDVVMRVIQEEPAPPRRLNPKLHPDLETIALKAMDKSKDRRYAAAGELADDLQRWLDGELISARPATTFTRLLKAVQKNRVWAIAGSVALGAIAVALILLFVGLARVTREKLETQSRREQAQKRVDEIYRRILDVKRGQIDLAYRAEVLAAAERLADEAIAIDPGFARSYAERGQIYDLQGRAPDQILGQFARAIELDSESPYAWQYRGWYYIYKYEDLRPHPEFRVIHGVVVVEPPPPETPLEKELTGKAMADLARVDEILRKRDPPSTEDEFQMKSAVGMIAINTGRYREALQTLNEANRIYRFDPWINYEIGIAHIHLGNLKDARSALDEAVRKGETRFLQTLADLIFTLAFKPENRTVDERETEKALELISRAEALGHLKADAYPARAAMYSKLAEQLFDRGQDPSTLIAKGIADCDQALQLKPGLTAAYANRGVLRYRRAKLSTSRGEDFDKDLDSAIDDYVEVLKNAPAHKEAALNLATALNWRAANAGKRGQDPEVAYARAIESGRTAVANNPDPSWAYGVLADSLQMRGTWRRKHGQPWRDDIQESIKCCNLALEGQPASASSLASRGYAFIALGDGEAAERQDPRSSYQQARRDLDKAIELSPDSAIFITRRGVVEYDEATWDHAHGRDPSERFELAAKYFQKASEKNPRDADVWDNLGNAHNAVGIHLLETDQDPRESFNRALECYRRVTVLNPRHPTCSSNMGKVYGALAQYSFLHGGDPVPSFEESVKCFEKAVDLNPKSADALEGLGTTYVTWASVRLRKGENADEQLNKALEFLDRASREEPSANLLQSLGAAYFYQGKPELALKFWEKAIEIEPIRRNHLKTWIEKAKRLLKDE